MLIVEYFLWATFYLAVTLTVISAILFGLFKDV